jgi:hypothetical protein
VKKVYLAQQKQSAIVSKRLRKHKAEIKAQAITKAREAKIQKKMMANNEHRHILSDSRPLVVIFIYDNICMYVNKLSLRKLI